MRQIQLNLFLIFQRMKEAFRVSIGVTATLCTNPVSAGSPIPVLCDVPVIESVGEAVMHQTVLTIIKVMVYFIILTAKTI